MAMTRTQMVDEVRENIKRTVTAYTAARIIRRLDWGQNYVSDLHTYEEMRKVYEGETVASRKRYGFPTRMKDIYSMTLQSGASSRVLTYTYGREFDKKIPRPETASEGKSSLYVDYGLNFELYKIPDAIYDLTLRCSIYPKDMTAHVDGDDATSDLLRKDALVVALATWFGFLSLREVEDATYWKDEVADKLYVSSVESDHSAEDWSTVARGFTTAGGITVSGEYWTSPFVTRRVSG